MLSENWIDAYGLAMKFWLFCFVFIVVYVWDMGHLLKIHKKVGAISSIMSLQYTGYINDIDIL